MKNIILFLLLGIGNILLAQNSWPSVGSTWYYSFIACDMGNCPFYEEYIKLEATKDTIINAKNCTQIKVSYTNVNGSTTQLGYEYMYTNGNKVYNYHHDDFYLMYDFDAQIGDKLNLFLGTNSNIHNALDSDFVNDSVWVEHVVTERDSIEIDTTKKLYLKFTINDPVTEGKYFQRLGYRKIVKDVGNFTFLFGDFFTPIESDYYGPLRCYSDNEINYVGEIPCDTLITSVLSNAKVEIFEVYPNPAKNYINIGYYNENCKTISVKIYNTNGQIVKQVCCNDKQLVISTNELQNGLYFFKLSHKNEVLGGGKFVK